jgi:hypothetical protein
MINKVELKKIMNSWRPSVINKPCAREAEYMRLIFFIRHHGSEHIPIYRKSRFTKKMWICKNAVALRINHAIQFYTIQSRVDVQSDDH